MTRARRCDSQPPTYKSRNRGSGRAFRRQRYDAGKSSWRFSAVAPSWLCNFITMSDAGFWIAWGLPTQGREPQALATLKKSRAFLAELADSGRIERYDAVILRPQTSELGGFFLVQGSTQQIDQLRRDADFERWVNQVQIVADRVGIVDAWVNDGLDEATDLYTDALREAGLID